VLLQSVLIYDKSFKSLIENANIDNEILTLNMEDTNVSYLEICPIFIGGCFANYFL